MFVRRITKINQIALLILVILILTFMQGLISAPSTTDSMVYHITRVMYWIQEGSVFQDTVRNAHDFMPPLAEYITLHLYLFTGNDRLLFLSQWFSYVFTILLSGLIAGLLGATRSEKVVAVSLVATIPIAVMQATSTQTDMVYTNLVMISLYLSLIALKKKGLVMTILLGIVFGMGLLVKPLFVIFIFIPIGVLMLGNIKNILFRARFLMMAVLIALIMQTPFYYQNIRLFGTPWGLNVLGGKNVYVNSQFTPQATASNILRNIMINIPVPILNRNANTLMFLIHEKIGIGLNDPKTTYVDTNFSVAKVIYPQEDIVGNPVVIFIIGVAALVLFGRRKNSAPRMVKYVYLLALLSFIIFSLLLKWQPFHSRLLMPFYVIGTLSGVLIISKITIGKKLLQIMLLMSYLLSIMVIIFNVSRPYISYSGFYDKIKAFAFPGSSVPEAFYQRPRIEQYFNARWYWYKPYYQVVDAFGGGRVTFDLMDGFEYPIWVLLKEKNINYYVVPISEAKNEAQIIATSKYPIKKEGYDSLCYKTDIDYGYACLIKKR